MQKAVSSIRYTLMTLLVLVAFGSSLALAQTCNIEVPAEEAEVNVIAWAFPIMDFYIDELEACNDVDNIDINTQLLDNSGVKEQVSLSLSGGGQSPFAILHGANVEVVEWASQGWVQPITDLVEKYRDDYNLDDISEVAWQGGSFEGEIYGVPVIGNTQHLMYRMDLFEEYGLSVPTTYDEVMETCQALEDEASIDLTFTVNLHAGWAWEQEFFHFIEALGGTYINEDGTPAFNNETGVEALNKLVEVAETCMGAEGLSYSVGDSEVGLGIGTLGFAQLWASRAASMDDPERSSFVEGIGFAPAPALVAGGKLAGSAWNDFFMIPTTTDVDRELAFLIIMEAADLESQTRAAEFGIVTRNEVVEAGVGGRYLEASVQTIDQGVGNYVPNPAIGIARSALSNYLPLVGSGDLTAEEALAQAEADYIAEATEQGFIQ